MYEVIIVGGGPTGIALATLLGRRGVRVAVVEQHDVIYPLPRAVHVDDETYRILYELGIGEEFAAISRPALGLRLFDRRHRVLAQFERGHNPATGLPQANLFDQPDLERLLRRNLEQFPTVDLLSGHQLLAFGQGEDGVRLHVRDPAGGQVELRASYLVGCDGANSLVAAEAGIANQELGFEQRWLVVDVRSEMPVGAWGGVHQVCDPQRPGTFMQVGPDRYRWEFRLRPGEDPAAFQTPAALRPLIDPWVRDLPDDALQVLRSVEYTFRARVAKRWRAGRVLLAGDAAHLTPPFIGQGLCTGLRDVMNLAWKLAEVLQDESEEMLLDSYEAERRPHATWLVRKAVLIGRIMTGGGAAGSLGRRVVLPVLPRVPGLTRVVLDGTTPALVPGPLVSRHVPRALRGTLLPLVTLPGPDGTDVLVDRLLGDGRGVVALPGAAPGELPGPEDEDVRALVVDPASPHPGERLLAEWLRSNGVRYVVVRPDRVVLSAFR